MWQPIETAPAMTHVLCWFPEGKHVVVLIGRTPEDYAQTGYYGWDKPTHWMPLPEAPSNG